MVISRRVSNNESSSHFVWTGLTVDADAATDHLLVSNLPTDLNMGVVIIRFPSLPHPTATFLHSSPQPCPGTPPEPVPARRTSYCLLQNSVIHPLFSTTLTNVILSSRIFQCLNMIPWILTLNLEGPVQGRSWRKAFSGSSTLECPFSSRYTFLIVSIGIPLLNSSRIRAEWAVRH